MTEAAPSGLCPACLLRTAIEHGASRIAAPLLPKLRYLGDYELLEEVARGGMGVVYRARQVSLDRTVAVKMMRPGLLATEDEIRRFQAEARTAAGMQHPNIVAIHEVGDFEGLHYFSMDFVEGPSLADLVHEKPLAQHEAARYVQVLAAAVHYAHQKGILHRDLKPSNVLVDAAGRPRITDFGLARPMEGGAGMTVAGTLVGTPAYMPPEQAAADGAPLTAASDCYSLGAILYELLTGRPPFQASSPVTILRMVLEQRPVSPRSLNPEIDRDLEAICLRCLEKDALRRYQSAAELSTDLERFLNSEPVAVRRPLGLRLGWAAVAPALILLIFILAILRNHPPVQRSAVRPPLLVTTTPTPPAAPPPVQTKTAAKKPPAAKPAPVAGPQGFAVSPAGKQIFTFRYSQSPAGAPISAEVEFLDSSSGNVCRIFVFPDADRVSLQLNPLGGPGLRRTGKPGGYDALENAACSVDLSGAGFTRTADALEVRLPVSFKPDFSGPKTARSWPLDNQTGQRLDSPVTISAKPVL